MGEKRAWARDHNLRKTTPPRHQMAGYGRMCSQFLRGGELDRRLGGIAPKAPTPVAPPLVCALVFRGCGGPPLKKTGDPDSGSRMISTHDILALEDGLF